MVAPLNPGSIPSKKFRVSACGEAVTAAFAADTDASGAHVPVPLASQMSMPAAVKLNVAMVQKKPYSLFLFVIPTLQRITFNNQ